MKKIKILIVEDQKEIINNYIKFIKPYYMFDIVGIAMNGEEAISLIKIYEIDVIILDIIMNKLDGIEVIKYIKMIETNKVYMVNINDGKIINIMLAGIEKENIKNIDNINLEFTINKVKEFEETKVDKIRKEKLDGYSLSNIKVNNSKKIIKSSISDEINSAEEKYSYNFNTEELIYTLNCKKVENVLVIDDSPIETMETATLEIKL